MTVKAQAQDSGHVRLWDYRYKLWIFISIVTHSNSQECPQTSGCPIPSLKCDHHATAVAALQPKSVQNVFLWCRHPLQLTVPQRKCRRDRGTRGSVSDPLKPPLLSTGVHLWQRHRHRKDMNERPTALLLPNHTLLQLGTFFWLVFYSSGLKKDQVIKMNTGY